jgi:hypothetical protein
VNAAERGVNLNVLVLAVSAFVHVDSASGHSGRQNQASEQASRVLNRVSVHGNQPLAKLYAGRREKVP